MSKLWALMIRNCRRFLPNGKRLDTKNIIWAKGPNSQHDQEHITGAYADGLFLEWEIPKPHLNDKSDKTISVEDKVEATRVLVADDCVHLLHKRTLWHDVQIWILTDKRVLLQLDLQVLRHQLHCHNVVATAHSCLSRTVCQTS